MNKRKTKKLGFLFLLFIMPLFLILDFSGPINALLSKKSMKPPPCSSMSSHQTEFILKEYDTVVEEIRKRIEHEHLLFVLQFTSAGAILAFITQFYRKTIIPGTKISGLTGAAICAWAAVNVCAMIDVRLNFNQHIIWDLGSWVKSIESCYGLISPKGWESYYSSESSLWNSELSFLLRADRHLLSWILYCILVFACFYFPLEIKNFCEDSSCKDDNINVNSITHENECNNLIQVGKMFLPMCMILFGLSGIQYYFGIEKARIPYLFIVAVFAFLAYLLSGKFSALQK